MEPQRSGPYARIQSKAFAAVGLGLAVLILCGAKFGAPADFPLDCALAATTKGRIVSVTATITGNPGEVGNYALNLQTQGPSGTNSVAQSGPVQVNGDGRLYLQPAMTSLDRRATLTATMQVSLGGQTANCSIRVVGQK